MAGHASEKMNNAPWRLGKIRQPGHGRYVYKVGTRFVYSIPMIAEASGYEGVIENEEDELVAIDWLVERGIVRESPDVLEQW